MLQKTKGIVLKTINYGESSIVASIYTEKFGIQSYIVNSVRTTKKSSAKMALYQPASILQMVVYHHPKNNLNRISEAQYSSLYKQITDNVIKNCIALYMVELLYKSIKQPETNEEMFDFIEDSLHQLDKASIASSANFPIYFSIALADHLGFKIYNNFSKTNCFLNLSEGTFTPQHTTDTCIQQIQSEHIAEFVNCKSVNDLYLIKLNKANRNELLQILQKYFQLHVPDFGQLKTLKVLPSLFA